MENNGEFQTTVLERLDRIEKMVSLLAEEKVAAIRIEVETRYLTTDARRRMWQRMDGTRSYADIARDVQVSGEAVRIFVQDLLKSPRPVVHLEGRGQTQYPRRLL